MTDFAQAPWVGNPEYRPGVQDCSTSGDYPDYPAGCDHCGDLDKDCACKCCNAPDGEHLCVKCCIAVGCLPECDSKRTEVAA